MLPIEFIYIAAAMRLAGGMAYLSATLRGRAKPDPVSWLLWGITPIITAAASIQAGAGPVAIVMLAVGISPLLVFAAAMYKNHRSLQLRGFNLLCALIAVAGITLWIVTHNPLTAIAAMIIADFSSSLPTVKKSWQNPTSEFSPSYLISALSMVITLLTITSWTFANTAFPAYVLTMNMLIFWMASRKIKNKKRRKKRRKTNRKGNL